MSYLRPLLRSSINPLAGPEVEKRIDDFRAANGPVLFGGRLKSETDPTLALPDNLGANLVEAPRL